MFGNQQQKKKPKFEVRLLNLVISEKGEEAIPNSTTREKTQQERAESWAGTKRQGKHIWAGSC